MKQLAIVAVLLATVLLLATITACTGQPPAEEGEAAPSETPPAETVDPPTSEATGAGSTPATPAPGSAPTPAPAPTPVATPEPVIVTLEAGTTLTASFQDDLSSAKSQVGDSVRARVVDDVMRDGVAIIPAGSEVVGMVTEAVPLTKKIGGRAKLTVVFTSIELASGGTATIRAAIAEKGKSETKKDAATIGGAAAGGAILGSVIKDDDKEKGALIGAVVGAAAGTAVAMKTQGEELEMPAGTVITVVLDQPAEVTVQP